MDREQTATKQANFKSMKNAIFHVGLAKCASTYFGEQIQQAAQGGEVSAAYWRPWDVLLNASFAEVIGSEIVAFPQAGDGNCAFDRDRHFVASNECLTGHFPQPLRMVEYPLYTADHLRAVQENVAHRLKDLTDREFADYRVKILLIVRSPESWLRSVYKNLVLMGVAQLPEQYFQVYGDVLAQWANVDYLARVYRNLFGDENVLLLPFEMLCDDFSAFADAVNSFAGARILLDGTPKNSGLSDEATEYFRQFWMKVDGLAPPVPSWSDLTVQYKQHTWEFVHNAVLNDREKVIEANAVWASGAVKYEMPRPVIDKLRANMQCLKNETHFSRYLAHYFA